MRQWQQITRFVWTLSVPRLFIIPPVLAIKPSKSIGQPRLGSILLCDATKIGAVYTRFRLVASVCGKFSSCCSRMRIFGPLIEKCTLFYASRRIAVNAGNEEKGGWKDQNAFNSKLFVEGEDTLISSSRESSLISATKFRSTSACQEIFPLVRRRLSDIGLCNADS